MHGLGAFIVTRHHVWQPGNVDPAIIADCAFNRRYPDIVQLLRLDEKRSGVVLTKCGDQFCRNIVDVDFELKLSRFFCGKRGWLRRRGYVLRHGETAR
ncbi:hypothetical protein D3C72_1694020 [compost metagenome]